ncbi:MAG: DUF1893 domain-containing protein [Clostridiales bacterium]|nr:DUF1893 domain-containing protein [Clostridiales bacterium]
MLLEEELTCAFIKDSAIYKSKKRGVLPLIEWYDQGLNLKDFSVADKVVGKAAAFLYVILEIKELYADVISKSALELLIKNNINVSFGLLVDYIRNRTNTGFCPMEQATINIDSPAEAVVAIKNKINELNSK